MPIVCVRTYEVRCDGVMENGEICGEGDGTQLSREEMIDDAESSGWLRRGHRIYCPSCRAKYEKEKK